MARSTLSILALGLTLSLCPTNALAAGRPTAPTAMDPVDAARAVKAVAAQPIRGRNISTKGQCVRAKPTTASAKIRSSPSRALITLRCKVKGQIIGGNTIWYKVYDGWMSARYIQNLDPVPWCDKPNPTPGPTGPAGADGRTGPTGAAGAKGDAGPTQKLQVTTRYHGSESTTPGATGAVQVSCQAGEQATEGGYYWSQAGGDIPPTEGLHVLRSYGDATTWYVGYYAGTNSGTGWYVYAYVQCTKLTPAT